MAKEKAGARARSFLKLCMDSDDGERALKVEDLKMLNGDIESHWFPGVQKERKGRPILVINKIPQFVKQVCNEQRQNSPQVKITPSGITSNPIIAKLLAAIVKNIESQSRASEAYDTAFYYAVSTGEGYFRIVTEYSSDDTFDQDIRIKKINNTFSVYIDPNHQRIDGSDSKRALIGEWIDKKDYKERFGKDYSGTELEAGTGDEIASWTDEERVRIAEYWEVTEEEKEISLLTDGRTVYFDELKEEDKIQIQEQGITVKKKRNVMVPKVTQYIVDGNDEPIETTEWAGKYIPIVKVTGDETWIEGKRFTSGIIRQARDSQKMYNYWRTHSTELVALAPKAPFLVTPKQIENHQKMWDAANTDPMPYLLYNESASAMPQRVPFANSPVGAVSEALGANDDMKEVTGVNDASKGRKSNETSGKAILARKSQGDIANFNYIDNMGASVAFAGRILVDLIPKIYDAERIVRIETPEGKTEMVPVNKTIDDPTTGIITILNDITVGEYDVEVTTGPNYATQRQEAVQNMTQLIQYAPETGPIIADLIAEMMDSPISDKIAARLKKMLPPQLQEGGPPPVPPEIQQKMQEHEQIIQKQAEELQKLQQDQSLKQAEFIQNKELSQAEMQFKVAEMNQQFELEVEQMTRKHELAVKELEQKYALKKYEADLDAQVKHEANMAKAQSDMMSKQMENESGLQDKGKETEKTVAPNIIINMPSGKKTIKKTSTGYEMEES
jgi:Phage P22-like portal protein